MKQLLFRKIMFCLIYIFFRYDLTWTYLHSIINFYWDTGGTPQFSFYFIYWSHIHKTSHKKGILYLTHVCIFNSSRRELIVKLKLVYLFSNAWGRINNIALLTWYHLQMAFSLTLFGPRKTKIPSWFFFKKIFLLFSDFYPSLPSWNVTKWSSYSCLCEKISWFHPRTIVMKILGIDFLLIYQL